MPKVPGVVATTLAVEAAVLLPSLAAGSGRRKPCSVVGSVCSDECSAETELKKYGNGTCVVRFLKCDLGVELRP